MDFTKFVSLLEKKALFFCPPDDLGDPFEGAISPVTPPSGPNIVPGKTYLVGEFDVRHSQKILRVNCWHMGEFESEAMWRLYAREHDGIAVKTVFARFKEALIGDQAVFGSKVHYQDYQTDPIPYGNVMLPLVHKRNAFRHEQEFRALYFQESDDTTGGYCEVDLLKLIEEVVVAPFSKDWFLDLVRSLAKRYGICDRVRRSTLSDDPMFIVRAVMPQEDGEGGEGKGG